MPCSYRNFQRNQGNLGIVPKQSPKGLMSKHPLQVFLKIFQLYLLWSPVRSLVEREGEGFLFLLVLSLNQGLVAFPKLMSADLYNNTHIIHSYRIGLLGGARGMSSQQISNVTLASKERNKQNGPQ